MHGGSSHKIQGVAEIKQSQDTIRRYFEHLQVYFERTEKTGNTYYLLTVTVQIRPESENLEVRKQLVRFSPSTAKNTVIFDFSPAKLHFQN